MNETNTPRTDEESESAHNIALWCDTGKHGYTDATHGLVVDASLARTLEMELNAATAQLTTVQAEAAGMRLAIRANILGNGAWAYILEQFPAVDGHIPIRDWFFALYYSETEPTAGTDLLREVEQLREKIQTRELENELLSDSAACDLMAKDEQLALAKQERDKAMEALKQIHEESSVRGHDWGDAKIAAIASSALAIYLSTPSVPMVPKSVADALADAIHNFFHFARGYGGFGTIRYFNELRDALLAYRSDQPK